MNLRSVTGIFILITIVVCFITLAYLNNTYLRTYKLDVTEDKIYSLSDASKKIINEIDSPIHLKFFFSETTSKGYIAIRDYAKRVESLLNEYNLHSDGKIQLEVINPEPFSEQEDEAASFGLTSPTVGVAQDSLYFGLVGSNSNDETFVIGFFDPQKEPFLEYDISSLIYKLSNPELPKLTIVSDLALAGGQNPLTGQFLPPNVIYQQLNEFFDVDLISNSASSLPDTDVLLLWHPQDLSQNLLYEIDQFIVASKPTVILYDPHYESDPMSQMGAVGQNSSDLNLLENYGIDLKNNAVVLDNLTGMEVRTSQTDVTRHLGYLGLTKEQINTDELVTSDLETINGASFGALGVTDSSNLTMTTLLYSSLASELVGSQQYATISDISLLRTKLSGQEGQFSLAARFSGPAYSYFSSAKTNQIDSLPNDNEQNPFAGSDSESASEANESANTNLDSDKDIGEILDVNQAVKNQSESEPPQANAELDFTDMVEKSDNINVLIIADADMAADRFWVQQSNFFGQTILTPFANNSDLLINIIENMGGSEHMIGIRGQGTFARPFERVQSIQMEAEKKFRAQEQLLQERLQETEVQLQQLQTQTESLALSDEQQKAIDNFTQQKIEIRKSLREVQFQLEREINQLGNLLKLANIVYAPIALVILLIIIFRLSSRQYKVV